MSDKGDKENSGVQITETPKAGDELASMRVVELKKELNKRKLKKTGSKAELIARLETALTLEENDEHEEKSDNDDVSSESDNDDESETEEEDITTVSKNKKKNKSKRTLLTFKDVEESIQQFSGDDQLSIRRWLQDFEDMSTLCDWTSVQKIIYAKRLLRGSAKIFVNYERCDKTWARLKKALKEEFARCVDSRIIHKKLASRRKKTDETYHEYVYKMLEIAGQAEVEIGAIIQYIIDGIQDEEVNKSVLYGAKNIRELKERLIMYETMKSNVKSRFKRTEEKAKEPVHHKSETVRRRCFSCGSRNHRSEQCPTKEKGVKCFKCQEYGHFASKCTTKVPVNTCSTIKPTCKKCHKEVYLANNRFTAIIDTGSDLSLMRAEQYIKIGAPKLNNKTISFCGIGSSDNSTLGQFTTEITIDSNSYPITFNVVSDILMQYGVLIGTDFLNTVDIHIRDGNITINEQEKITENHSVPEVFHINITDDDTLDLSYINYAEHRKEIEKLRENYVPRKIRDVDIKMRLVLQDDIPVYQRARRLSPLEKQEVDSQIKNWLEDEIIQPSHSDYASPVVLVKKKNGSTRLCVDYRQLNKKILKDRYPLPLIEDQIDRLQGARVFSTLDLKNAFFHVKIEESSRKYTAFVIPNGQYEFLRVPFGLCNSPSIFQRYINAVFKDLIANGTVLTYMDDLVIPSLNSEDGLERLRIVLEIASEHGLLINWEKCRFIQSRIEYLGNIIENGNIRPSENKTTAVMNFPKPTSAKHVQSFLGLTGYFRKFIPRYSIIARPLTNLLRTDVKFRFGYEEEEAFEALKLSLSDKPVLRLYRAGAETQLHTDASSFGFGAILLQRDSEDNVFHPVFYASWKTTPTEEKYTSYELEVLAVMKSLKKFRVYLLGISFKILTDCQAFALTMKKRDLCVRVARWALHLEEFDYVIEHRPGKSMSHVDALSRYPLATMMLISENESGMIHKLKKAQREDNELRDIVNAAEQNCADGYILRNGLLYKCVGDDVLVVVPKCMQMQIIRQAHERGHFGITKTEAIVKKDYWTKNLRSKIERVVQSCIHCILAERKLGKQEGFLHNIDKGNLPLDTYHVDHLGPITTTKKRYRHILVVTDAFTKFVWLYGTRSTDSAEVLDRLKKQAVTFGNPKRIITDRGTAFTSHAFKDYCAEENIHHTLITTGIPRGNGQVERVNRTLIPLLTKLSMPRPEEWYKHLEVAQKYLNSTPSRSTGETPFKILFGIHMRIREDPEIRQLIEDEWLAMFEENRDQIRKQAKENILKIQTENRRYFNKKRKNPAQYQEGTLVAIKRTQPGTGGKFSGKFLGPYSIEKVLRNDRYLVKKIGENEGPQQTSTSADNMKPWASHDNEDYITSEEENV